MGMKKNKAVTFLRITAIVLLVVVAFNALAAGYSFITDPSGKGLGITTSYLKPSAPFTNYFIPGIVLFVVNGVLSIIIALVTIYKKPVYPVLLMMQGCVFTGWIAVQLMMVTAVHPLHFIIGGIGIILFFIGWFIKRSERKTETFGVSNTA
jgi:hypothetical protein